MAQVFRRAWFKIHDHTDQPRVFWCNVQSGLSQKWIRGNQKRTVLERSDKPSNRPNSAGEVNTDGHTGRNRCRCGTDERDPSARKIGFHRSVRNLDLDGRERLGLKRVQRCCHAHPEVRLRQQAPRSGCRIFYSVVTTNLRQMKMKVKCIEPFSRFRPCLMSALPRDGQSIPRA
jgi:hypothetical protein